MSTEDPEGAVQDPVGETPPQEPRTPEAEITDAAPEADAGELEQLQAKYLRALADYDNLKRRSADDVQRRVDAAVNAIFKDMIDLADDFERAFADDGTGDSQSWREGVALIRQKLLASLDRRGVSPIAAENVPFDPDYHEAIGEAPGPLGEIVAELRRGYLSGGRVLRASQVLIGAGRPEPDPQPAVPEDAADQHEKDTAWHE